MTKVLLTSEEINETHLRFAEIKALCSFGLSSDEMIKLDQAFEMALNSQPNQRRLSGEPYLYHSLSVARIVIEEFHMGGISVVCALLHDALKYSDIKIEEIYDRFGKTVGDIIKGLARIESLYSRKATLHADNYIKLLLNLSNDVRIILVKLADRLDNMRTLEVVDPETRKQVAIETSRLYAPIAHRLGLYNVKNELEELSMKFSEPEIYNSIHKKLQATEKDRNTYINKFTEPLSKALLQEGMAFNLKKRIKSVSSIWRKMQVQKVEFDEVYDLFAIRIILESKPERKKDDCWKAYSIVTNLYQPNPNRLRDWISSPKESGYESLHTTVIGPDGKWVEVQIRTRRMDEIAEKGFAAHWKYKEKSKTEDSGNWLLKVRDILENPVFEPDRIDDAKKELYSDKIFAFTPQGDLKKLNNGDTILDFAFQIHSKVGYSCTGAKVNGRIVSLKYKILNGDTIEILTSKNQRPKQDWLKWVNSTRTISKIKRALKEDIFRQADEGKEFLKKKLSQWKIDFDDQVLLKLQKFADCEEPVALYQKIANEEISIQEIKQFLADNLRDEKLHSTHLPEIKPYVPTEKIHSEGIRLVVDHNPEIREYLFAKCCNPIQGEPVFAFVTVNKGITIHRMNCPNAPQMKMRFNYRVLSAEWRKDTEISTILKLNILGSDRIGILNSITNVISSELNVNMVNLSVRKQDGNFVADIDLQIEKQLSADSIVEKLRRIPGIKKVSR